jgi:hypothetical protein
LAPLNPPTGNGRGDGAALTHMATLMWLACRRRLRGMPFRPCPADKVGTRQTQFGDGRDATGAGALHHFRGLPGEQGPLTTRLDWQAGPI